MTRRPKNKVGGKASQPVGFSGEESGEDKCVSNGENQNGFNPLPPDTKLWQWEQDWGLTAAEIGRAHV